MSILSRHIATSLLVLRDGETFSARLLNGSIGFRDIAALAAFTALSTGVYGAVLGFWRSWTLAAYVAVKLPAVFLGTTLFVSVFNWTMALMFGARLCYRDVFACAFGAMARAGWFLLAAAPVSAFLVWTGAPAWNADLGSRLALRGPFYSMLLAHTAILSLSGVAGNVSLFSILRRMVPSGRRAMALFASWLAAFALVGSQLSWMARPIFGSPNVIVAFLREDALKSNAFESFFGQVLPYFLPNR